MYTLFAILHSAESQFEGRLEVNICTLDVTRKESLDCEQNSLLETVHVGFRFEALAGELDREGTLHPQSRCINNDRDTRRGRIDRVCLTSSLVHAQSAACTKFGSLGKLLEAVQEDVRTFQFPPPTPQILQKLRQLHSLEF